MSVKLPRTGTAPGTRELSNLADISRPPSWGLLVVHSPDPRLIQRFLPIEGRVVLGRIASTGNPLASDDSRLSREHAAVTGDPRAGFHVEDLQSRNGTFVDGVRRERAELEPGAILRVGDTLLQLVARTAAPREREDARLVGWSDPFQAVLADVRRLGPSSIAVLLTGETGTGKELVAARLHELSGRSGACVAVNCAALPPELCEATLFGHRKGAFTGATADSPGFFGEARGGTLFLDEIAELPLAQQAKLLRVLDTGEYAGAGSSKLLHSDARIVAATNVDLRDAVGRGRFRDDLFARLAGAEIRLPPLRARRADIPLLARRFLAELAPGRKLTLGASAIERLVLLRWPRNIRELRAALRRLVLHVGEDREINVRDLDAVLDTRVPEDTTPPPPRRAGARTADRFTRPPADELADLLSRHQGTISRLAEHYGKNSKQVYRWLSYYGLDPEPYRRA